SLDKPLYAEQWWSWISRILPQLEQDNFQRQIDFTEWPWYEGPAGDRINGRPLKVVQCPADPRNRRPWVSSSGQNAAALTSYLGASGPNQLAYDGIPPVNAGVRLTDVTDGTSSTVLVGERPPSYDLYWGWWLAGSGDWPYFASTDTLLGVEEVDPNNQTYYSPYEFYRPGDLYDANDYDRWHFWSLHPGGGNWLLADGSVRFISYSAGTNGVLRAMATYSKGEVVSPE